MALKGSKVVFVGNIPYDTTEETMIEIFQEVGPVVNFRINKDRETGKAKGYGFCEYHDAATAASAVRNLDGYGFGGRQLKVAPADSETPPQTQPQQRFMQPQSTLTTSMVPNFSNSGPSAIPSTNTFRPPIQSTHVPQVKPNPNLNASTIPATKAIEATLATMSPDQIFELLTQVNIMVQYSPETARSFLSQNPQLCYALFQALFILKLIDPEISKTLLANSSLPEEKQKLDTRPTKPEVRPPFGMQNQNFPTSFPQAGLTAPMSSSGYEFQPNFNPQSLNGHNPLAFPPPHQFAGRPPQGFHGHHQNHHQNHHGSQMPHNPTPGLPPQHQEADQNAILMQVMQMTPDQIDSLPAEHRDSLLRLRASLMNNNGMPPANRY